MKTTHSARVWLVAALLGGTVGCSSNEDRCEEWCVWVARCGEDADCSDEDLERCEDLLDERGDDCLDDFDAFLECVDENPECSAQDGACADEIASAQSSCIVNPDED